VSEIYPTTKSQRDRWIVQRRGPKASLDAFRPYAFLWEEEPGSAGVPPAAEPQARIPDSEGTVASQTLALPTATIFLTNRECPFRCLMCDLWQNTLDHRVPSGAIAAQIRYALERLPAARYIKLYNAGSFFDPQAIPPEDLPEIAALVRGFDRVIVECHPAFLRGEDGRRALRFQAGLRGQLEIAIGLETVHPPTLEKLNKRMTVEEFRQAAEFLKRHNIDLRVFILLRPPFQTEAEGLAWACRALDVAAECGAKVCSIIPVRGGNGAIEALGEAYQPPTLRSLEAAVEYGLSLPRTERPRSSFVFADLWDVEKFFDCGCSAERAARLQVMNRTQQISAAIACPACS
jgi:archaeosine synthase beta-subunit